MSSQEADECCPRFEPGRWDGRMITWDKKLFLQERVRSFLHIPLNFGDVMKRSMTEIEAAGATPDEEVVLSDENSLWGADVYIAVSKEIPGVRMTALSGTYLAKVFEGPYSGMRRWIGEMNAFVAARGKVPLKLYFFYTTCPKCAKKYGQNYVVILAQIEQ
jgi:hypothetical protein